MTKSAKGVYLGISPIAESAFGTKQTTGFELFNTEEPGIMQAVKYYINDDQYTGRREPTEARKVSAEGSFSISSLLTPAIATRLMALAMGTCVNTDITGGASYKHQIKLASDLDMKSVTIHFFNGINKFDFPGCICTGFRISGNRNDWLKFSADMAMSGQSASSTVTKPTLNAQSPLKFGDLTITQGGTISAGAEAVTSGTSLSTTIISLDYSFKNGGALAYPANNATDYAKAGLSGAISHDLKLKFLVDDSETLKTLFEGDTYTTLIFTLTGGVIGETSDYYKITCLFPKVKLTGLPAYTDENGALACEASFQVLDPDGAYDAEGATCGVVITTQDNVEHYLQAS